MEDKGLIEVIKNLKRLTKLSKFSLNISQYYLLKYHVFLIPIFSVYRVSDVGIIELSKLFKNFEVNIPKNLF